MHAAEKLGRNWIGIDITCLATNLIKHRLRNAFGDRVQFRVIGEPTTLDGALQLASDDPFQFQCWALGFVSARATEQKRGADGGIDGRLYFHEGQRGSGQTKQIIFSVKSGHVHVRDVRELQQVVAREKAQIGALITLEESTGPMDKEAATAGFYTSPWGRHPKTQIVTIEDLLRGKTVDYPLARETNRSLRKAPAETRPERGEQQSFPGIASTRPPPPKKKTGRNR